MTWYQSITPDAQPHDIGLHEANGRPQVVFTARVVKAPSDTFLEEVMTLLEAAGVGTRNVTIFASSDAQLPANRGDAPFLHLQEEGGVTDLRIHNDVSGYARPSVVVTAMGETYVASRALARAAYAALHVVRNVNIVP